MAINRHYTVKFKRKRKHKTDYKKRLKLLKSNKLRLVVRKSLDNVIVQIIGFKEKGDIILVSTDSRTLKKFGWKGNLSNIPAAYLTGLLCGLKAKKKDVKEAILDYGLRVSTKGSSIYAALKGIIDAGIKVPHNKDILPDDKKISGEHIENYAKLLKKDQERFAKQFSRYIKNNFNLEEFKKHFQEVKNRIVKENG